MEHFNHIVNSDMVVQNDHGLVKLVIHVDITMETIVANALIQGLSANLEKELPTLLGIVSYTLSATSNSELDRLELIRLLSLVIADITK